MITPLLELAQLSFPVAKRPFDVLAKQLGISENEAISEYKKLKEELIIRQTSAILEAKKLGYSSSLVAFKLADQDIENAVELINSHPGVSHNYLRSDSYNVWFTIMTEPDSVLGLEKTVELIAKKTNAIDFLLLPTKKLYKIGVHLKQTNDPLAKKDVAKKELIEIELTPMHKRVLDLLQVDIEAKEEPFSYIIEKLNIDYEELIRLFDELKAGGYIRRFATILNHKKAGFGANAMGVWQVDESKVDEIGKAVAGYSAISHCYRRTMYPNRWEYNLYTMIHGKSEDETNALIKQIRDDFGITNYKVLYSTKEFKKQRIHYFSNSFKEWESKHKDF